MSREQVGSPGARSLPRQPDFAASCTIWDAFDVPRMWDSVSSEDDPLGWEQTQGFQDLEVVLRRYAMTLARQRDELATAWQSPAGAALTARLNAFIEVLYADANCSEVTARGLDGVMETLGVARGRMAKLAQQWDRVTTDWAPEWWDHSAEKLNEEGRSLMAETDLALAYHRTNLIIPDQHGWRDQPFEQIESGSDVSTSTGSGGNGSRWRPPPVPGYEAMARGEAGLAGGVSYVPAVPGQPVSMLPVPPGSQFVPYGGAYVLPGPGVGRGGYVVPMPPPNGTRGGAGTRALPGASGMPGAGGRGGGGMVPGVVPAPGGGNARAGRMPGGGVRGGAGGMGMGMMPAPGGAGQHGAAGGKPRRAGDTQWPVPQGVPAVIGPPEGLPPDEPEHPEVQEAFRDWFTELALPWRNSPGSPLVAIHRRES